MGRPRKKPKDEEGWTGITAWILEYALEQYIKCSITSQEDSIQNYWKCLIQKLKVSCPESQFGEKLKKRNQIFMILTYFEDESNINQLENACDLLLVEYDTFLELYLNLQIQILILSILENDQLKENITHIKKCIEKLFVHFGDCGSFPKLKFIKNKLQTSILSDENDFKVKSEIIFRLQEHHSREKLIQSLSNYIQEVNSKLGPSFLRVMGLQQHPVSNEDEGQDEVQNESQDFTIYSDIPKSQLVEYIGKEIFSSIFNESSTEIIQFLKSFSPPKN